MTLLLKVADAALEDLLDRKGIGDELSAVKNDDPEIWEEIRSAVGDAAIKVFLPEDRDDPTHTAFTPAEFRFIADYIALHHKNHESYRFLGDGLSEYSWRMIRAALAIATEQGVRSASEVKDAEE